MAENIFPTVRDMRAAIETLIGMGLGDLPVQLLLAPDSTLQAIARTIDPGFAGKPALMIDLCPGKEGRLPASIISADRLSGNSHNVTTQ